MAERREKNNSFARTVVSMSPFVSRRQTLTASSLSVQHDGTGRDFALEIVAPSCERFALEPKGRTGMECRWQR